MPPDRTLSDADIRALADILSKNHCTCSFTNDEVAAVRDILRLMQETRSNLLKGIVTLVVGALFVIIALGAKVWVVQK